MTSTSMTLPIEADAERCLLGAILVTNNYYWQTADIVTASDFSLEANRIIYMTAGRMLNEKHAVDLVTITADLRLQNILNRVGGAVYVSGLTDGIPKICNAANYAEIIHRASKRRQIAMIGEEIKSRALSSDDENKIIDESMAKLAVLSGSDKDSKFYSFEDTHQAWLESMAQKSPTMSLGFHQLNSAIEIGRGEMLLVAGFSMTGKTTLALNLVNEISTKDPKAKIAMFSVETQVAREHGQLLQNSIPVNKYDLRNGYYNGAFKILPDEIRKRFENFQYRIDPDLNFERIHRGLRMLELSTWHAPADYVIVDHLSALGSDMLGKKTEVETMTWVAHQLPRLVKNTKALWIVLIQLNAEHCNIHEPVKLAHIRSSKRIIDAADAIIGIFRPDAETPENDNRFTINVLKNRQGALNPTGIDFRWDWRHMKISEITDNYPN